MKSYADYHTELSDAQFSLAGLFGLELLLPVLQQFGARLGEFAIRVSLADDIDRFLEAALRSFQSCQANRGQIAKVGVARLCRKQLKNAPLTMRIASLLITGIGALDDILPRASACSRLAAHEGDIGHHPLVKQFQRRRCCRRSFKKHPGAVLKIRDCDASLLRVPGRSKLLQPLRNVGSRHAEFHRTRDGLVRFGQPKTG